MFTGAGGIYKGCVEIFWTALVVKVNMQPYLAMICYEHENYVS